MMDSKRLSRLTVIIVALTACGAFIALAVTSLEYSTGKLATQMVGVLILVGMVIGLSALTAFLIRLIIKKRNDNNE